MLVKSYRGQQALIHFFEGLMKLARGHFLFYFYIEIIF